MEKAKNKLEEILEIYIDLGTKNDFKNDYIQDVYAIENYNVSFISREIYLDEYNFFIFSKFTPDINTESASVIMDSIIDNP